MTLTSAVSISIPGEPRGWARARASAAAGFVRLHNPKSNDEWRASVQFAAVGRFAEPLRGPVVVSIEAHWSRPAGHIGKRGLKPSAPRHRTGKPDVDNLAKGILDSLNGIAWHDDRQVVELVVRKAWADDGGARTVVTIRPEDDTLGGATT